MTSNIASSVASVRESVPRFKYGPYRPFCAVIGSPEVGSTPTTRGSESSLSASARVIVCSCIDLSSEPVRGFGRAASAFFFAAADSPGSSSGSGRSSVTYGPYRPLRATIDVPVIGSAPST